MPQTDMIYFSEVYADVVGANKEEKRNNIYKTSANIIYNCNANWLNIPNDEQEPSFQTGHHSWKTYSTSSISYVWIFNNTYQRNDRSGQVKIESLILGEFQQIRCEIIASGTFTITTHHREDSVTPPSDPAPRREDFPNNLEGWKQAYSNWLNGSSRTSLYLNSEYQYSTITKTTEINIPIYTRPGTFTEYNNFTGGSTGTIIQSSDGLTVSKVNNWITHCNKFAHWYNQDNTNTAGTSCQATAGGLITAGWYNACVDACADYLSKPAKVTGGPNGTILTPAIFAALGAAISKEDPVSG